MFKHLPQILILIHEHLESILQLLILLIEASSIIVKFFNRLSKFCIDFDKFLQRLFQDIVLLLQLHIPLFQLLELALAGEVVVKMF